ncbi:MAG: toll/interleukin-1 receptor domain-containing protein [Bacteroidales bacterium]|nr:toll/interleukin-1 receptor domain-containing protein [Bacteroidales bacterium]
MEKFISKPYLKDVKDNYIRVGSYSVINESKQKRSRSKYINEVSVFLSHKHDEINELENVIALLNTLGVELYIDWLDEGMPKETSGVTATKLKSRINSCSKFIFLATDGAINSKWCNWELGYGDAKKYPQDIAVMPITNQVNSNWDGSEYLQIYPIITYDNQGPYGKLYIEFQGKKTTLDVWLKS